MLKLGRKKSLKELLKLVNIDLKEKSLYKETFYKFKGLIDRL